MTDISAYTLIGPVIGMAIMCVVTSKAIRRMGTLIHEKGALEARLAAEQDRVGAALLPTAIADAGAVIAVMNRSPNEYDRVDIVKPFIWINATTNQSWRATVEPGEWVENTQINQHGVIALTLATPDDLTVGVTALVDPGVRERILAIAQPHIPTTEMVEHIRALHPGTCAAMDMMRDGTGDDDASWVRINAGRVRETPAPEQNIPDLRRNPLHMVGDTRRAIDLDDDPLDNESQPR